MLRCIGACAGELAVEHTQVIHVSDSECFPTMWCTARAVTAYLIREQQLDSLPNSVVMGFDDARSSVLVDELDKRLLWIANTRCEFTCSPDEHLSIGWARPCVKHI